MKQINIIFLAILFCIAFIGCEEVIFEDVPEFDKTEILSFKAFAKDKSSIVNGNPAIDQEAGTVTVVIKTNANISDVFANCTLTSGATLSPSLDGYADWSSKSKSFTVTSPSGKRSQQWTITFVTD